MQFRIRADKATYLFFLGITFLAYFNSLGNSFIFDDKFLIVENSHIKRPALVPRLFKEDIFYFQHPEDPSKGTYYRPLQSISYALEYPFWKLNPSGYRLTNIILHSLAGYFLFLLLNLIFKDKILAILSSVFFCIHPINTFVVSSIAARSNLLEAVFIFLSLITFIKYCLDHKKYLLILSLFTFILSLLSREGALLLPFFLLLCSVFLRLEAKKTVKGLLPFMAISLFYLFLRAGFIPCDKFNPSGMHLKDAFINLAWSMQYYLINLILPSSLKVALFGRSILCDLILFAIYLSVMAYVLFQAAIRRERVAIFALLFYITSLLPVVKLAGTFEYFGAVNIEHYAYMASIGFFLILALLFKNLSARFKDLSLALLSAAVAVYFSFTVINNYHYKDEVTFYNHVLRVDPENTFVRVNLGVIYCDKKMFRQAGEQARMVLAKDPRAWDAYLLLGNIYSAQGEQAKAVEFYKKAQLLYPRSAQAANNLALIYKAQGKEREAEDSFRLALRLDPESTVALKNFTAFLIEKKAYNEAILLNQKLLDLDPDDAQARLSAGIILAELGYFKEAKKIFEEGLRKMPDDLALLKNLAALYANHGDLAIAESIWRRALRLKPDDMQIKDNIRQLKKIATY
ncbi:MAG: tetratricopeptide repeat protein [Candidatus Omnitrophica bacterium]|nr:tetratricopeptide repeat protein [Candidatus Omnitrophota bacterium]